MKTKNFPIIGTKSSLLWDEDTDAWVYISGEPTKADDPRAYYKIIPTLFRAVDIRASAIANLPWALMKGENEYETSQDYQNKTGLISNMDVMLYLIEASLCLAGSAYWKREKNPAGYNKLRHLNPTSLALDEKKAQNGIIEWKRNEPQPKTYTPKEIIYLWYPDPFVEIGPPMAWPVKSSLNACGVLANLDEFSKNYFGRGAIKAMLFSMQGASRTTAEEFEHWWDKYIGGIRNVFRTKVLNADVVTPIVVGEGIKELEDVTLAQEKREEIALAMAIPMSMLFSNAANYATAERDKLNWYEDKVVPEAKFIASILNEQLFDVLGLRLVFRPETLDIFQEDEKERSMALGYLFNAGVPLDIAFRILGFELTDEDMARIVEQAKKKEERAEEFDERLEGGNNGGGGVAFQPRDPKEKPEAFGGKSADPQQLQRELSLWQNKCLSALKRDETASSVAFVPVHIPGEIYDWIEEKLVDAENADKVKEVFVNAFRNREESQELVPNLSVRDKMQSELSAWKENALNRLNNKELAELVHEHIPDALAAAIEGALEETETEQDITDVFTSIWLGYP